MFQSCRHYLFTNGKTTYCQPLIIDACLRLPSPGMSWELAITKCFQNPLHIAAMNTLYLLSIAHICIISKLNNCCRPVARFQTVNVKKVEHHHAYCTILLPRRYGLSVRSAEYSVRLVGVNRVSACKEFCGMHSWENGARFRDGVKLLWRHSRLVPVSIFTAWLIRLYSFLGSHMSNDLQCSRASQPTFKNPH